MDHEPINHFRPTSSLLIILCLLGMGFNLACGSGSSTSSTAGVTTPAAAFTTSASSVTIGTAIQFTDTSTNAPTSWAWSFGDGTTSSSQNPTHAYSAGGSYTVTLTATNGAGSSTASANVQALTDASAYGFTTSDVTGNTNFAALATMAAAANAQGYLYVKFAPGNYLIRWPSLGESGYIGEGGSGKCQLINLNGVKIEASNAKIIFNNETFYDQKAIEFSACKNVAVVADFTGTHMGQTLYGEGSGGVALWFKNDNHNVNLKLTGRQMHALVQTGTYEDPKNFTTPQGQGNSDFDAWLSYTDVYGIIFYLTDNINIYCEASGTAAGGYGCHRGVIFDGCNNCHSVTRTKDMGVPDGINLVGSAPRVGTPDHVGCTDVWIDATDLGTTLNVPYQVLAKINIMTSTTINTPVTFDNINMKVSCRITDTNWANNSVIYLGSQGTGHKFSNITISGQVTRTVASTGPTVAFDSITTGVASFDLVFRDFHETYVTIPTTLKCYVSGVPLVANAWQSDVGTPPLFKDPSIQSLTVH